MARVVLLAINFRKFEVYRIKRIPHFLVLRMLPHRK